MLTCKSRAKNDFMANVYIVFDIKNNIYNNMKIIKKAQSGSFESSDIIVLIEPVTDNTGRNIEIDSTVMLEYGDNIKNLITSKLDIYNISDIHLIVKDKGALDPTINARLETAIIRASDLQKGTLA